MTVSKPTASISYGTKKRPINRGMAHTLADRVIGGLRPSSKWTLNDGR